MKRRTNQPLNCKRRGRNAVGPYTKRNKHEHRYSSDYYAWRRTVTMANATAEDRAARYHAQQAERRAGRAHI